MYIGKLSDTHLVKVSDRTANLDITKASVWSGQNGVSLIGKNFNRQLGSTDATPQLNYSDVEFCDLNDPGFSWPAQIQVGDRI
jgi:hypothetical protein